MTISDEDFEQLVAIAVAAIPPRYAERLNNVAFMVGEWPTREQLDWHLERGRTYAQLLGRAPLPSVGARAGEGVAYWVADWKHDRLLILWLDAAHAYEAEALVQAARNTAAAARLHEVRLWAQPWPFPGRADLGGDRVRRVGSVPMIAPIAAGVKAEMWTQIPRAVWV